MKRRVSGLTTGGGGLIVATLLAVASPAAAQGPTPGAPSADQIQARHEIAALERVLESAVGYGAQMLNQHVQAATTPESVLLTGLARARGFRLDGYGVLFDVEFPSIRRSVAWTMRALGRPDPQLLAAMKELRKNTQGLVDPGSRQELDRAIKTLEDQMQAYDTQAKTVSTAGAASANPPPVADPRAVYASEMTKALVNAILDQGAGVGVGPAEWLTVAARESLDMRFMPDEANGTATTLILRIKGSDLAALREGRLSREEARARMEVKQY